jgi:hypothetical protein
MRPSKVERIAVPMDSVNRWSRADAFVRPFSRAAALFRRLDRLPTMRPNTSQELTFGYLSVVHIAEHGYFGGYLVVALTGRPLEFHCTAPVRPTRAQEILYGPTLQPYLLGEQIGGTLLCRAKTGARLILTDQSATLCVRSKIEVPLVRLLPRDEPHVPEVAPIAAHDYPLAVDGYGIELAPGFATDRGPATALLTQLATKVDLAEPFDRIHEAIREAQRISTSTSGQNAYGQAA